MRRALQGLLLALLFLLPMAALAQQGQDITAQCRILMPGPKAARAKAFDRKHRTRWNQWGPRSTRIEVQLPQGVTSGGLYLCFAVEPALLEVYADGDSEPLHSQVGESYAHRYLPFEGAGTLRIELTGTRDGVSLAELYVFSGAEPPAWVQRWQPQLTKADLLLVAAHPDDELLWFGGAIPTYAIQRGKAVAVAYMTCANPLRRSEMLDGLWTAGVRHYPFIGGFPDENVGTVKAQTALWGGEEAVQGHLISLYRQLKPQVVLSHDLQGEYGHPAHILTARAAVAVLAAAADAGQDPRSAREYGVWDVPKLYLHLYPEGTLEMDWTQPLAAADGQTSLQLSEAAFQHHRSQKQRWKVSVDGPYSAARFGLVRSLVGEDMRKDDLFENIP